ncbi:MAG: leucine-rich repeat domain-containing protein [Terriglobia bacterium]|jgi:Leucine-rich repeat (LRR) protein
MAKGIAIACPVSAHWIRPRTAFASLSALFSFPGFWRCSIPSRAHVRLANLTTLELRDNQLTSLPPETGQLTNLKDLSL